MSAVGDGSTDSKRLEIVEKAEEWLKRFHEITSDASGDRERHLEQRHCVESTNWWATELTSWKSRQDRFCRAPIDADKELDRVLSDVRSVAPELGEMLQRARELLSDLHGAIQQYEVAAPTDEMCREWFARNQSQYQQLRDGKLRWATCSSCSSAYWEHESFESHFRKIHHSNFWPCSSGVRDGEAFDDEETISRHLETSHSTHWRNLGPAYLDTQEQLERVELAAQRCRQLYNEAAEQILRERMTASVESAGDALDSPSMDALKEIRTWLDEFHVFAADEGGKRAHHLIRRSFGNRRDRIYGETLVQWNDTYREFDQVGRMLNCRLDRVQAAARVLAPAMVKELGKAREGVSNLRRIITEPKSNQDAYDSWREAAELAFYMIGDRIALDIPEVAGTEGGACPLCYESFNEGSELLDHFFDAHPVPSTDNRVLMSPEEHVRAVEDEVDACRRIYTKAVEVLGHLERQELLEDECETSVDHPAIGTPEWRRLNAKNAANVKHDRPGGSRDKQAQIRAIWRSGKYSTKDLCAEEEYEAIGMSHSAARRALQNQSKPTNT